MSGWNILFVGYFPEIHINKRSDTSITADLSPSEALTVARTGIYDAIFTRQSLPDSSGIELSKRLREKGASIPIILVTTNGSEELAGRAVSADVTEYLSFENNVDPETILHQIEKIQNNSDTPPTSRIIDRITDGFFVLNQDFQLTYLNTRAEETFRDITGTNDKPLRGRSIWKILPGLQGTEVDKIFRQAIKTQDSATFETQFEISDEWFEFQVYSSKSGIYIFYQNITDRYRREEQLEAKQTLTRSMLAALPDSLYVFDADGQFLRWNETFRNITGYNDDEIERMHPADFIAEEDTSAVLAAIESVFEEQQSVTVEAKFITKSGISIPHEFTGAPITDNTGETTGLVGIGRDISDRKEQNRRFQAVFNNTYQFTGLMEPDGTFIEVNRTAIEFGGFARSRVINQEIWKTPWFQLEDLPTRLKKAVKKAASGEFVRMEIPAQGQHRRAMLDFSIRPVLDDKGSVELLVPEGRDITEIKRREKHLDTLQRVLRHNLRNELTATKGYAEILANSIDDPTLLEHANKIIKGAEDLLNLSESARQLSQTVQSDDPALTVVRLKPLIDSIMTDIAQKHPDSAISVEIDDPVIQADDRIKYVIHELVDNAIKHNGQSNPQVHIAAQESEESVQVSIIDNGPLIPDVELSEINTQLERTDVNHGSGLGLRLAKLTIEDYGGEITHQPREPEGNILTIELPVASE